MLVIVTEHRSPRDPCNLQLADSAFPLCPYLCFYFLRFPLTCTPTEAPSTSPASRLAPILLLANRRWNPRGKFLLHFVTWSLREAGQPSLVRPIVQVPLCTLSNIGALTDRTATAPRSSRDHHPSRFRSRSHSRSDSHYAATTSFCWP